MRKAVWFTAIGKVGLVMLLACPWMMARVQSAATTGAPSSVPLPSQIHSAKTVFISNAGADGTAAEALQQIKDADAPYEEFYAAMKAWGRYALTDSPSNADLVLEIHFTDPLTSCGKVDLNAPQLALTIIDAKAHFTLWTFTEPVKGAFRASTFKRNLNAAVNQLVGDVKNAA
ncbi:MAG: hypothetical protein WAN10_18725 [Candidatus Acidiferrales bacterium]